MKKIAILSVFLVLAVLLAGNALAAVTIDDLETKYTTEHNSNLAVTITLSNDDVNPVEDYSLSIDGPQDWIDNTVINNNNNFDIPANNNVQATLTFSVPKHQPAGTHKSQLILKDEQGNVADQLFFDIEVLLDSTVTIDQATVNVKGQSGESQLMAQETVTIENTGNEILTIKPLVKFGDGADNILTIDDESAKFKYFDSNNALIEDIALNPGDKGTFKVVLDASGLSTDYATRAGTLYIKNVADDNHVLPTAELKVKLGDRGICKLGPQNEIKIRLDSDSDIEDNLDEDFRIGEKIELDFQVENKMGEDRDIEVEVVLYNVDTENVIDYESDEQDVDSGDEQVYKFELVLDADEIEGEDEVILLVKAYANDRDDYIEENYCSEDIFDVTVEQKDVELRLENLQALPTTVESGDTIEFITTVVNYGKEDVDNVRLVVKNSLLNIDVESERYSIEEFDNDKNDNEQRYRLTVEISADTESNVYEFEVYAKSPEGESIPKTVTVTVEGEETPQVAEVRTNDVPLITGSATGVVPSESGSLVDKSVFDSFKSTSDLPLLFWIILDLVLVFVIVTVILLVARRK